MNKNKYEDRPEYSRGIWIIFTQTHMYPYFDIAHYILMCLALKEDINHHQPGGGSNFHKKHPLACYVSSMILCFGGGILAHFILGEPILEDFKSHQNLALATSCWYIVFYSPFDIFYKTAKFTPVKVFLSACKEVLRCRKIYDGVNHAMHIYPNSYVIIVLVGAMKGAGSGFLIIIDRFNRGIWVPNTSEILHPSFASKGCFFASILFTMEHKSLITMPRNLLFLCITLFFCLCKINEHILSFF